MSSCLTTDKKIKIMRGISPGVDPLAQELVLLQETESLKVLTLDKFLFLRAVTRKLS